MRTSGLAATAERHGFLIAAPEGAIALEKGRAWNIPGVPTTSGTVPGTDMPDDVAYIAAVIDALGAMGYRP